MTDPTTVEREVLERIETGVAELVRSAVAGLSGEALMAACEDLAQTTLRQVYAATSQLAAEREPAPTCAQCGRAMQRHEREQRPVRSLWGEVRGTYQRWRCRGCGQGGAPSYDAWVRGQCSPRVLAIALYAGAHLPYEEAESLLAKVGLSLSDNTLQRLMRSHGGAWATERQREARAYGDLAASPVPGGRPERLYLMVDGFKAQCHDGWREPRVGVVFETAQARADEAGQPPEARRLSLVSALADADETMAQLACEAARRGLWSAREVVLVADGASWIWDRLPSLVPMGTRVVEVLDWYHLVENLAKAARAVHGEGGGERCLERLKTAAWVGQVAHLARLLGHLRDRLPDGDRRREVANVLDYVRRHRQRINYQKLQLEGYHVGSGQVESACKRLGQRVKGAGMRWSHGGLNAVLAVLANDLSDPEVRWKKVA